jgi:hypothetical protein
MRTVEIKQSGDLLIKLPEGFGTVGEKLNVKVEGEDIIISKMVSVELELSDEDFLYIAKKAHREDITFNEMCVKILEEAIERLEEAYATN